MPNDVKVIRAACGGNHSAFLTGLYIRAIISEPLENLDLYCCGLVADDYDSGLDTPTFFLKNVREIGCGEHHFVAQVSKFHRNFL